MYTITEYDNAIQIPKLFKKFEHDYHEYVNSSDGLNNIVEVIKTVTSTREDNMARDMKRRVTDIDRVTDMYEDINGIENNLKSELLLNNEDEYESNLEMDFFYWKEIVEENLREEEMNSNYDEDYEDYYRDRDYDRNEDSAIEDLFSNL